MKNILAIFITLVFFLSLPFAVMAQEKVILKVSGLVCSFCVQGVKKSFEKTETTESVDVDLDNHQVTLVFLKDKNLSDEEMKNILQSSGYTLLEIKRSADKN